MLFALNGFVFESTRSISTGFFLPARTELRPAAYQTNSMVENSTESIRISAKEQMSGLFTLRYGLTGLH